MPGFGYSSELLLIFIVALLVFGPKRLPDLAKSLGRAMNEFKRSMNEFKRQIETEVGTEKMKEDLLRQQKEIQDKLADLNPVANKIETEEDYAKQADQPVQLSEQAAANKASAPAEPARTAPAAHEPQPETSTPANTDVK